MSNITMMASLIDRFCVSILVLGDKQKLLACGKNESINEAISWLVEE